MTPDFRRYYGNEFVSSWQRKTDSEFTRAVEAVRGLRHKTIPPRAHTWQSDVETAHRLIEDDLYEVERFSSRSDFLPLLGVRELHRTARGALSIPAARSPSLQHR